MTDADFAAAVWASPARTLASGTPGAPTTRAEVYAAAAWTYPTRTAGPPTFLMAVRARLLSAGLGLADVYRRETPARPPAGPYAILNVVGESPYWNTGGTNYPADATVQMTVVGADADACEAVRDAAYKLFTPRKVAGVADNTLPAFADGLLPACGSLPGRKYEWRQPNKGPNGQPAWFFAFDCRFYVTRSM